MFFVVSSFVVVAAVSVIAVFANLTFVVFLLAVVAPLFAFVWEL